MSLMRFIDGHLSAVESRAYGLGLGLIAASAGGLALSAVFNNAPPQTRHLFGENPDAVAVPAAVLMGGGLTSLATAATIRVFRTVVTA